MIETALAVLNTVDSVFNTAEKVTRMYDWVTGVSAGDQLTRVLAELERQKREVQRLSDLLLYAPGVEQVVNLERTAMRPDPREVRELLHPLATTLGTNILSTAVLSTPTKLRRAFEKDPWELFVEIRPVESAKRPSNPDLVPILFTDAGRPYVGWQMRGALPQLFDCEFREDIQVRVLETASPALAPPRRDAGADADFAVLNVLRTYAQPGLYIRPEIPLTVRERFHTTTSRAIGIIRLEKRWRGGDDGIMFMSWGTGWQDRGSGGAILHDRLALDHELLRVDGSEVVIHMSHPSGATPEYARIRVPSRSPIGAQTIANIFYDLGRAFVPLGPRPEHW